MITILLYNYRHVNKVMEEKTHAKIDFSSLSKLKNILHLQKFINFKS